MIPAGEAISISFDGGYADYVIAPAEAVAAIPDDLVPVAEPAALALLGLGLASLAVAGRRRR